MKSSYEFHNTKGPPTFHMHSAPHLVKPALTINVELEHVDVKRDGYGGRIIANEAAELLIGAPKARVMSSNCSEGAQSLNGFLC